MSTESSSSPDIGLVLNARYRVLEMIARGGMATVYRGFDERLHRDVALKIMHPHLADNPEFISRFSREARSAARLTHPHVVNVYDQGEDQGRVYLAMQLVEGETLRDELRRQKVLTLRRALRVGRDVLAALDAAHRSGIIHRDIKPENVLVNSERNILVADFGLARAVGSATSSATGTMLGTVAYVSPEVVTRGVSDARSDLYSWGIMMFEMLTGRTPFTGDSAVHIAYQHAHEDIPAPSSLAPGIPSSIDALITWAAARLPSSRPARAHEVLLALDEALITLTTEQLNYRCDPTSQSADQKTQDVPQLTRQLRADASLAATGADTEAANGQDSAQAIPAKLGGTPDAGIKAFLAHTAASAHPSGDDLGGGSASKVFSPQHGALDDDESVRVLEVPARLRGPGIHTARAKRSPLAKLIAGFACLILAATTLYAGIAWYSSEGPGADRAVPLVSGASLADAEAALKAEDLAVLTQEVFSKDVPAGHIVSVSPETGSTLKKGSTVTLVVSKGEELFAVPNVVGQKSDAAVKSLEDAGFKVVEEHAYSSDVPAGAIIDMNPKDTSLPHGSEVSVTLSDGPEPVEVPNVGNQPRASAIEAIKAAGLTPKVSEQFSNSVPAGQVISQKPAVGESVLPGTEVSIAISLGPDLVEVPNVFSKSEADARAALESAGFKVTVVYERGSPVFGLVSQQSQPAGTKVARGSTITLNVY